MADICEICNGKKKISIPCPDKKLGCAAMHLGPCPKCGGPEDAAESAEEEAKYQDAISQKVWLTTHASRGAGGKPSLASITLNNIAVGIRFEEKYDGIGTQTHIQPMDMKELGLLRAALNKFWAQNKLED